MVDPHNKDTWIVFKIMGEFVEGFETLRSAWPSISIFGGSRVRRGSRHYRNAVLIAERLSNAGFSIITGGGPGIMEAANRGGQLGRSNSIGLNIKLPHEQISNGYADIEVTFNYFFARKVMFVKYACGIIGMPGGFGTLDEIFEALTLVQTQKIDRMPVILFGTDYWSGLVNWMQSKMLDERLIRRRDLQLFKVVDDPDEVVEIMIRHLEGLRRKGASDKHENRDTP